MFTQKGHKTEKIQQTTREKMKNNQKCLQTKLIVSKRQEDAKHVLNKPRILHRTQNATYMKKDKTRQLRSTNVNRIENYTWNEVVSQANNPTPVVVLVVS